MPAPLTPMRLNPSDPALLKLTEDTLAAGLSLPTLATRLGCDHSTVYRWVDTGTAELDGGRPAPELGSLRPFCDAIARGLERFETTYLGNIREASAPVAGRWQAAAWLLERRLPDRWGQRREIKLETRSISINLSIPASTTAELLAITKRRLEQGQALLTERTGEHS